MIQEDLDVRITGVKGQKAVDQLGDPHGVPGAKAGEERADHGRVDHTLIHARGDDVEDGGIGLVASLERVLGHHLRGWLDEVLGASHAHEVPQPVGDGRRFNGRLSTGSGDGCDDVVARHLCGMRTTMPADDEGRDPLDEAVLEPDLDQRGVFGVVAELDPLLREPRPDLVLGAEE